MNRFGLVVELFAVQASVPGVRVAARGGHPEQASVTVVLRALHALVRIAECVTFTLVAHCTIDQVTTLKTHV